MKKQLQAFYLEYLNDFLTIETFASYYGLSVDDAQTLVNLGRQFHAELTS